MRPHPQLFSGLAERKAEGRKANAGNPAVLAPLSLGIGNCFGFRISNFGFYLLTSALLLLALASPAAETNALGLAAPSLPDAGPSLLRVLGALAMVLGLFLGGVWLFRHGQQLRFRGGRAPRLQVLEARSLGGRQAIYVVGYDQERFLVAASPNGINLLSHLPQAPAEEKQPASPVAATPAFAQVLAQMLKGKA